MTIAGGCGGGEGGGVEGGAVRHQAGLGALAGGSPTVLADQGLVQVDLSDGTAAVVLAQVVLAGAQLAVLAQGRLTGRALLLIVAGEGGGGGGRKRQRRGKE